VTARDALTLALLANLLSAAIVQAPEPPPALLAGDLPVYPVFARKAKVQGTVRIRLSTDGHRALSADQVVGNEMLIGSVQDAVKTWVFREHQPTTFEAEVRFKFIRDEAACSSKARTNGTATVDALAALTIEIAAPGPVICEWWDGSDDVPGEIEVSRLDGVVRCEGPEARPVAGAEIVVDPAPVQRGGKQRVVADSNGRFRLRGVADGEHVVRVALNGYVSRRFTVRVDSKQPNLPKPRFSLEPKRPPEPIVEAATLTNYPDAARSAGVEGVVRLRIARDSSVQVLDGPAVLATVAEKNVKSWRLSTISTSTPLDVLFRFRLLPANCMNPGGVHVVMDFPNTVDVAASRLTPCG
jgi:hypothetical protein